LHVLATFLFIEKILSKMFKDLRDAYENQRSVSKTGRFVTMKPKTPTVAAKFHDSLTNLLDAMAKYEIKHSLF
jgi:myosin-15